MAAGACLASGGRDLKARCAHTPCIELPFSSAVELSGLEDDGELSSSDLVERVAQQADVVRLGDLTAVEVGPGRKLERNVSPASSVGVASASRLATGIERSRTASTTLRSHAPVTQARMLPGEIPQACVTAMGGRPACQELTSSTLTIHASVEFRR
jgi:hypothetical protein